MGRLYQLWDQYKDPTDAVSPYTPYTFTPRLMEADMGFGRRESVVAISGMDDFLDGYGHGYSPSARRDFSWKFRVMTGKLQTADAARDLLVAQVAPGYPQRLVYLTDPINGTSEQRITVGHFTKLNLVAGNDQDYYHDFQVVWRIRPDWRPLLSENAVVFRATTTFNPANNETFSAPNHFTISTNPFSFGIDATGTAGLDLPTLNDYAPVFSFSGPLGGPAGLQLVSTSVQPPDNTGNAYPLTVYAACNLPTSGDTLVLDFGRASFVMTVSNVKTAIRPTRPFFQREWMYIAAGINNQFRTTLLDASPATGGAVSVDWTRKFG